MMKVYLILIKETKIIAKIKEGNPRIKTKQAKCQNKTTTL